MYARPCWKLLLGTALMISASAAFGQTTAAQQPANTAQAEPIPVLKMTSNLVLVDVVVTNHDKAVHGLDRSKFHLFEDGQEQAITAFDEHRPGAIPAKPLAPSALPPHFYNNAPAYAATDVMNVLLLDGLNTPATDQMRVRQQMIGYLGKIQPGTMLAIFTLSTRLRMATGFTTDIAQLTKTIQGDKVKPDNTILLNGPTAPDPLDALQGYFSGNASPRASGVWGSTLASLQQFAADHEDAATNERILMTLDALNQLGLYLSGIPGRKNLIWFSGSFPISLNPQFMKGSRSQGGGSYEEEVRNTDNLLAAARVAVYPVDARGLTTMPGFQVDNASIGPAPQGPGVVDISPANGAFEGTLAAEHGAMREIAELTGGRAIIDTNGLGEAVASAVENGASYYTLAYTPPAKDLNGQFRKIKVSLDARGDDISYRRGYYAGVADKTTAQASGRINPIIEASSTHGAPPATQVLFLARVLPASDPQLAGAHPLEGPAGQLTASLKGPVHRYVADLQIDPRTLAFETTPAGLHQAVFECTLVAYDADGKRLNYDGSGYTISLNANQYARVLAKGLPARVALDVPAGENYLRIIVYDKTADRAGSLEVPLAVAGK